MGIRVPLVKAVVDAQEAMQTQTASMAIAMGRTGIAGGTIKVEYSWTGSDSDLLYITDILVGLVEHKRLAVLAKEEKQRFNASGRGGRKRRE